jgi:MoxR-like ATPase
VEFKSTFLFGEAKLGDLKVIKLLGNGAIFLAGTQACAVYSPAGNMLSRVDYSPGRAVAEQGDIVYIADNDRAKVIIYDPVKDSVSGEMELTHRVNTIDVSPEGSFLFTADEEENRLGIYDLRDGSFLGFVEGYGYSIVKVSADGSIYTSRYEEGEEGRLYFLEKFESNLIDFLYPKERQQQIIKNAEKLYKSFTKSLSKETREENLPAIKEFQELYSIDIPIKRVRELVNSAQEAIRERAYRIFVDKIRAKLRDKSITGSEFKEINSRIETSEGEWRETLEALKSEVEEFFKKELETKLGAVRQALSRANTVDVRDLEALREVKEAREFISKLPAQMQEEALSSLTKTLQEKVIEDRLRRFSIKIEEHRVMFGAEEVEKFRGEPVRLKWHIEIEEKILQNGETYGKLIFTREDGRIAEPKRYNNILKSDELRHFPKWVNRYLRHLNGLCSREGYRVPDFVSYEETPWFVRNLERFSALVKEQLDYEEGILILEGDAGVGKNFLVEVFSALTNRPLFIIPCNSKMEKEDITFMYEFDPRRGTRRVYSDIVKALRTPGAVIYLDEINTLPPSLVKIFNPLFDYRRYLVLSYGEVVKARSDVIIVGGMNPQNYLGVSELPQDIKSRADVMFVDYPPFKEEQGFYYPDEAIILKDYMREVSRLSNREFTYLWYYVINEVSTPIGKEVYTDARANEVKRLFELLKIANEIRDAYRAYQMQQSEEPVEFVFSIRDTIRCARRLNKYKEARQVVIDTIIPKISSPLEREIVRSIIDRSL